jgi:hypothetical protein
VTKQSGVGDRLFIGGRNVSGDINSVGPVSGGGRVLDMTDITQEAMDRQLTVRDGQIGFKAYFNTDTGQAHDTLSTLPITDVIVSYFRGAALGSPAACVVAKQLDYNLTRPDDASLTFDVSALANLYGLEWGQQLTAGERTDTSGGNGTSADLTTVSTSFGWQAWLHVTAVTGTSVTVTLQDSADNGSFTNLSGGAFTAVTSGTGHSAQRLQSASRTDTVRRYLRAVSSGTFSSATFAVVFTRNLTAVTF